MLLSGLDNISFGGLGATSGVVVGPSEAVELGWGALSSACQELADKADFSSKLTKALTSGYSLVKSSDYQNIPDSTVSNDAVPNSPSDGIIDSITKRTKRSCIEAALKSLRSQGYYVVNSSDVKPVSPVPSIAASSSISSAPNQTQQPMSQSTAPVVIQSNYRPTPKTGDFWGDLSKDVSSIIQGWPKAPKQLETRYAKVPYRQTPKDKQRLIWIVGGFGVLFVTTMVVVASNSGD